MPSRVGVVIRNRNEAGALAMTLAALARQDRQPSEVVVVDNDSSDESLEVARRYGATIIPLATDQFSYGGALNLGFDNVAAEVVLVLSAHSVPLGEGFVSTGVRYFEDASVAAVNARAIDARNDCATWTQDIWVEDGAPWSELAHRGLINRAAFVRRSTWSRIPFDEGVVASEDTLWSSQVLAEGARIGTGSIFYAYTLTRSPAAARAKRAREETANLDLGRARTRYPASRLGRNLAIGVPSAAYAVARREVFLYALGKRLAVRSLRHRLGLGSRDR